MIFNKIFSIKNNILFKETFLYSLANALYSGLPFFLLPFLLSVLSPEEYGIIEIYKSLGMVLTPLLGLSTVQSISRYYFDMSSNRFIKYVSTIILFHFLSTLLSSIFLLLVSFHFLSSKYQLIAYLSILFFFFSQVTEALLSIYRVKKFIRSFLFLRVATVFLDLLFLFVFYFIFDKYDWTYRVFPNILSISCIGVVSLIILFKRFNVKFYFDKISFRIAVKYSLPLVVHMLAGITLNFGDRFFILSYLGETQLGTYSAAYQIGMSINFFYTSFNLAWVPNFFNLMKLKQIDKINSVKKIVYISLPIIGIIFTLAFVFFNNNISNLNTYNIDIELVLVIIISYIFLSYYKFLSNYFLFYKNTVLLSKITLFSSIIAIFLNFALVPVYGIYGCAFSTLASFFLMFLLCFYNLKRI